MPGRQTDAPAGWHPTPSKILWGDTGEAAPSDSEP